MTDTVFILVKATIRTTHKTAQDAKNEVLRKAKVSVSDTPKVKIQKIQVMDNKLK